MKFTREFLREELDLPFSAIEDVIVGTRRWSIDHSIVFEHEGKFYTTRYSVGATECQDEMPWEYDDEVECTEVKKVKKMMEVEVWEQVK